MPRLFAVTYLSRLPKHPYSQGLSLAASFHQALSEGTFPYDVGDDPAIFSSERLRGPITWGICRRDVRGQLQPNDVVVFFAGQVRNSGRTATDYYFVAALEVRECIRHTDIWMEPKCRRFRQYLNLLIRPRATGWEHYEPVADPRDWHGDWMWRLSHGKRPLAKATATLAGHIHRPGQTLRVSGSQLSIQANYVVFSEQSAVMMRPPLHVATYTGAGWREQWEVGTKSSRLYELVFEGTQRGLRTRNRQQPHRHLRRELPNAAVWLADLRNCIQQGSVGGKR